MTTQNFIHTFCFSFPLKVDGIRFPFCNSTSLLCFSFCINFDSTLRNFCLYDDIRFFGCFLSSSTSLLRFLLREVSFLQTFRFLNLSGRCCDTQSLCLFNLTFCIRFCNQNQSFVFPFNGFRICFCFPHFCIRIRRRNLDTFVHVCVGFTNRTISVFLRYRHLRIVDCFGRSLLTQCFDVARFVLNICYVYVD